MGHSIALLSRLLSDKPILSSTSPNLRCRLRCYRLGLTSILISLMQLITVRIRIVRRCARKTRRAGTDTIRRRGFKGKRRHRLSLEILVVLVHSNCNTSSLSHLRRVKHQRRRHSMTSMALRWSVTCSRNCLGSRMMRMSSDRGVTARL